MKRKIKEITELIMVLGAAIMLIGLVVGALVSCGSGDDATKSNDDDVVITPKTTEPEGDKEDEPVVVVEPTPQEPEPEPEPVLIGNPRTNEPAEPMPVDPEPQEPEREPEPPQLDERQLAEIAERDARVFLITNRERIWVGRIVDDNMDLAGQQQFWDEVYQEELGFGLFFMMEVLLPILEEEKPEEKEFGVFISEPFIVEYTILKFQHPDKNEDELLELFRASARAGNISIIPGEQKPLIDQSRRKIEPNRDGCVPRIDIPELEDFLQAPLPEDPDPNLSNLDKARVLWQRYQQRSKELEEQNPNMDLFELGEMVHKEVFGFTSFGQILLYHAYEEAMGISTSKLVRGSILPPLLEYVRLSFEFPNEDPEGLLCLLRESVRAGNVSIFEDNPKPSLGPMIPVPNPPAEEDPFLDQARDLVNDALQKIDEERERNPEEHPLLVTDRVFEEMFGFDFNVFIFQILMGIYLEEKPEEKDVFPKATHPLLLEYLRLSLMPPDKGEEELLNLFRQSVREGNVVIIPPNQKPRLER